MENFNFIKGIINTQEKIITIEVLNNLTNQKESINIDVGNEANNTEILDLIDRSNRSYSAEIFKLNQSENVQEYGCITSKVLGFNDFPITFMNAKYVINTFLELLQNLFKDEKYYFQRDVKSVKIPTSETNISSLIKDLMDNCMNNDEKMNVDDDDDDNNSFIDIKQCFLLILNYISNLSLKNQKKNNIPNLPKNANIKYVYDHEELGKSHIFETLQKTEEIIKQSMYKYRDYIFQKSQSDLQVIDKCMNESQLPLYQNVNISFKFMMQFICNVFNTLFLQILPQTSMINCLYATLYQASVLNELNILKYYSKVIQMPLLYRLIYSFFKFDRPLENSDKQALQHNNKRINKHNNYLNNNSNKTHFDEKIPQLLEKLSKTDKNINIICEIATRINISDVDQLETLFWLINDKRGYTYEFYIIVVISLYLSAKCRNMNKSNKLSNAQMFGEPLYNLLYTFYDHVVHNIQDLNVALCTETLDNFNTLYSKEIKQCLKEFFKNVNYYGKQK